MRRTDLVCKVGREIISRGSFASEDESAQLLATFKLPYFCLFSVLFYAHAPVVDFVRRRPEWALHEQVTVAACDIGDLDLAKKLFRALDARFPESIRVGAISYPHHPFYLIN